MTVSHSSAEMEKIMRSRSTPALLTRMLMSPYSSIARCTSDVAKSQSPMSPGAATASPPPLRISSATDSAPSPMSLTTTFAPAAPSQSASARPRPAPAPVTTATPPSSSVPPNVGTNGFTTSVLLFRSLVVAAEHERGRRHTGAARHQHMFRAVDLVHRRATDLAHALGDAVHAVDVGLAELTAVGVDRQSAADLDAAVGDEVLRLAGTAEAELLELREDERREVVVEDGGLDVGRAEPRGFPDLPGARPHLGQPDDGVPEERPHHVLVVGHALSRGLDDHRRLREIARPLDRRDEHRLPAVGLLAAVEQVQR